MKHPKKFQMDNKQNISCLLYLLALNEEKRRQVMPACMITDGPILLLLCIVVSWTVISDPTNIFLPLTKNYPQRTAP